MSRVVSVEGFRPAIRYDGTGTAAHAALVAVGQGLTLLPDALPLRHAGITAVTVTSPPLVHRVELIHGPRRPGSPPAELAALLI